MTSPIYTERSSCRSCGTEELEPVLSLGNQYLPRFVERPDMGLPRAPLDLVMCQRCGLLQLRHSVHGDLLFREFWYRSGINASMRRALENLVDETLRFSIGRRGSWLDIGANDGYLLSRVPEGFRRVACEPALNMKDELAEHSDVVVSDYFSALAVGAERFDVITSAAMFYDVDEPASFVRDIARSLKTDGVWINQLNDAPTMIEQLAFDSICHEHLCYYDLWSLDNLYRRHGLRIVSVTYNDVNGGSMRVAATLENSIWSRGSTNPVLGSRRVSLTEAQDFHDRVTRWRSLFRDFLTREVSVGRRIWGYGASTKGSTLLQYLDCPETIQAIADRNPRKHGLMMAGSWITIEPEEVFRAARPDWALVLPWAFKAEFTTREVAARKAGTAFLYPLPEIQVVV